MISKCVNCKVNRGLYGYKNEPEIIYCNKCKKSDMKNIRAKKCIKCNDKMPSFGYNTPERKITHCGTCKEIGMEELKKRKCLECKKIPSYNYTNETKALYCFDHKLEGMINILAPRCLGCNEKVPTYGLNGKKTHCNDCKTYEMRDGHKMCEKCNKIRANFGNPEEYIKRFCKGCAPEGFKDLSNYKCEICMDKRACFGLENDKKPRFCKTCMPDGASDIVHPVCKTELCGIRILDKYDGYRDWETDRKSVV